MLSSILHGVFLFSPFGLQALESRINACCYHTNCYEYSHIDSTANRIREMQWKGARLILGATIVDDILSIAVLSLVTTIVRNRNNDNRHYKYRISSLKDIRVILCIVCRRCCNSCVNSFFKRQNRSTKVGTGTI